MVLLDAGPVPTAAKSAFAGLGGVLREVTGDVRDAALLDRVFSEGVGAAPGAGNGRIEAVIHTAAVTAGSERERNEPGLIAEINLLGTIRGWRRRGGPGCGGS